MKRFAAVFTAALMLMSVNAFAVTVNVNSQPIDTEAVIVDGRTLVPVRGVFEALGYNVEWDNETKTATISNDTHNVVIVAGESTFTADGETITPEVPQQIIEGRFMLPLRAVGESVNLDVQWNDETKTVDISKKSGGLKIAGVQTFDDTDTEAPVNDITLQ